ncbi:MAG: L,D-transpeptidase family protein [Sphingobacteriaceae bacterium]|nr:L,D-transpeptidase family protein [Sphingobacteriaceae bacterium]
MHSTDMIKRVIKTALLVVLVLNIRAQGTFKTAQLKYERVRTAYKTKFEGLKKELTSVGFSVNTYEIYLQVFKHEKEVQVWMRNKGDAKFKLFKTYKICSSSGELGPKRVQGDGQVPEGFYYIEHFNPVSSYHLSMKVGYPNKSDSKKATGSPGGDIMIHGNCVTIGCIPIENDPIEELYILCVEAKDRKQNLRVDMFPCKFTEENIKMLNQNFSKDMNAFWGTLKAGYDSFETDHIVPKFTVDAKGNYIITK